METKESFVRIAKSLIQENKEIDNRAENIIRRFVREHGEIDVIGCGGFFASESRDECLTGIRFVGECCDGSDTGYLEFTREIKKDENGLMSPDWNEFYVYNEHEVLVDWMNILFAILESLNMEK